MDETLSLFHPEIAGWFHDRYGEPTEVQRRAWPAIAGGAHLLVSAPTGTGKTLAAFLIAIDRLVTRRWEPDTVRVLYVSPLKALNNDIRKNLLAPLDELRDRFTASGLEFPRIAVQTRSGDTTGTERRRMLKAPPAILITTPESLNLLVSAVRSRTMLEHVEAVILDEIHAVAGSKRGTHLMLGVARLAAIAGEFQRISLSATVRPADRIARFVGGARWVEEHQTASKRLVDRPVQIVEVPHGKQITLSVTCLPRADEFDESSVWERIGSELRDRIDRRDATLIFVNSRRLAEQLTRIINGEEASVAFAHHGSLAKELRLAVEDRLKRGELKAIVATSSLEMGIDIGNLDAVALVESPFSVSSAVQRIGRSGHAVGLPSTGTIYASHGRDLLDAVVLADLVSEGCIEETHPVEAPLDILAQTVVAMVGVAPRRVDELYDLIRTCAPYRGLSRELFDSVIEMLAGRYRELNLRELKPRIYLDRESGLLTPSKGALMLVYANGGTIPDRGYYRLSLADGGTTIGELDEEFVWERKIGDTFTLGTQAWRITGIDHQKVTVEPHSGEVSVPPFWRAEAMNRSFHFASRVSGFLEKAETSLTENGSLPLDVRFDSDTSETLTGFLNGQREATGTALPHRHHLVIEETTLPGTDFVQVFVHTLWGNRVNYPAAVAAEALLEREGWIVRGQSENDCMHFAFPLADDMRNSAPGNVVVSETGSPDAPSLEATSSQPGAAVKLALLELSQRGVIEILRERLEATGFFGARFRECAGRALLLPRKGFGTRTPLWLSRLRSQRLADQVARLGNFPITVETWRSCLNDEFELPVLDGLLSEIESGDITIDIVRSPVPSPFTQGIVWESTNQLVYIDDTPRARSGSSVDDDVVRAVVSGTDRPLLDPDIVTEVARKLARVAPGYAPEPGEELLAWIEERVLVSMEEWEELLCSVRRDYPEAESVPSPTIAERLVRIAGLSGHGSITTVDGAARLIVVGSGKDAVEIKDFPLEAIGEAPTDTSEPGRSVNRAVDRLNKRENDLSAEELLSQWLATRPPTPVADIAGLFAPWRIEVEYAIESMIELERILRGRFAEDETGATVIDAANYERVLRAMRRRSRRGFEPVSRDLLPLFLATWQGIVGADRSLEEIVSQLEGYPAPAANWEELILPSRNLDYSGTVLDSLISTTGLRWFGCGPRMVSFALGENIDLYRDEPSGATGSDAQLLERLFPDPHATYDFFTLHERSGMTSGELAEALWDFAWRGVVGCDSFDSLRRGIATGFEAPKAVAPSSGTGRGSRRGGRRRSFAEWSAARPTGGGWFRLPPSVETDAFSIEEDNRERVRVLIERYGIIFRDLLARELPTLSWGRLFRTMRMMELSGEILGGYFFDGLSGVQFASREAIRMLSQGIDTEVVFSVNATDPASLCGTGPPALRPGLPERLASNFVVYHGTKPVLVARRNGEVVEHLTDRREPGYLEVFSLLLSRNSRPLASIKLTTIDGVPALEHPDRPIFETAGFRASMKGLNLFRAPR